MVSILPAERSSWDIIGNQIGASLNQNIPQILKQQQSLKSIDQLQSSIKNATDAEGNVDYSKVLPDIAKAYSLNPSLERSGIAEKMISQMQLRNPPPEPGEPEKFPKKKSKEAAHGEQEAQKEEPVSVSDLQPRRESMVKDPQGVPHFQLPYNEEDIINIRHQARKRGYLPEVEERLVQDALEMNKVAETRRQYDIQNYDQAQKQRRDTLENQALFTKYLQENSPELAANPDEMELALKASEKYQKEAPSFADRNAAVKKEIRPYQAMKETLRKGLKRPLLGQPNESKEVLRRGAKEMVKMGQKPQLQLMIAQGGQGEIEEADLLNPLPKEYEKNLDKFGKFIQPLDMVTNVDPDSPEYMKQLDLGMKKKESQQRHMTDFLSREIVPGTYDNPGTNLLLTRYHLMKKGSTWEESAKIIDDSINKGKIKLDSQQQIDFQKLAYPPLTGDTYLDTVMNNLMFPITGKQ